MLTLFLALSSEATAWPQQETRSAVIRDVTFGDSSTVPSLGLGCMTIGRRQWDERGKGASRRLLWTCGERSGLLELQANRGDGVQVGHGASAVLATFDEPPEARAARTKGRATTQHRVSSTEPRLASGSFTTFGSMPFLGATLAGLQPVKIRGFSSALPQRYRAWSQPALPDCG